MLFGCQPGDVCFKDFFERLMPLTGCHLWITFCRNVPDVRLRVNWLKLDCSKKRRKHLWTSNCCSSSSICCLSGFTHNDPKLASFLCHFDVLAFASNLQIIYRMVLPASFHTNWLTRCLYCIVVHSKRPASSGSFICIWPAPMCVKFGSLAGYETQQKLKAVTCTLVFSVGIAAEHFIKHIRSVHCLAGTVTSIRQFHIQSGIICCVISSFW